MKEQILISNRDPVISHHTVHGRDLLPGLAYIDLLFQFCRERGLDFRSLELANATIYHPLVVAPRRNVLLDLEWTETGEGAWRIVMEGQDEWEGVLSGSRRRYLTTELRRIRSSWVPVSLDRAALESPDSGKLPLERTYSECRKRGLVHRGMMKPEGTVVRTPLVHLVEVELSAEAAATADEFMFHPGLIDACGVGSWASLPAEIREGENLILPFSFESFRAEALIQRRCTAEIRFTGMSRHADLVYLDLDFYDEAGRKVAELRRFASKLVRDPSLLDPDAARASEQVPESRATSGAVELGNPKAVAVAFVCNLVARRLGLSEREIHPEAGYYELGLDSILILEVTREIEARVGVGLSPTLLFEYTNIAELGAWLAGKFAASFPVASPPPTELASGLEGNSRSLGGVCLAESEASTIAGPMVDDEDAIAIIGMAGRYPGAGSVEEFWRNLIAGRDCITEVPADRWDWRAWDGMRSPSGKKISKWGGFIEGPDRFDADFFRISPREAASIDPQERLFLEVCWEAIEDAGYTPENLVAPRGASNRRDVGVFAGVMHQDYAFLGAEVAGRGERLPLALNFSSIPNRISYTFNFHGPSLAVDTACSSSLTAIHLAVESLRHGASRVAIAGGVNLSLHPLKYVTYGLMDMQSSDGRCRAFGEGGDGYVSGEGVGAVVLKLLSQAIGDRDSIYAVIKGSWINHGGKASGLTVPGPGAQSEVIADSLNDAGVDPRTIGCLEAHGTGTSLGDPIELEGLTRAFRLSTADTQFCALGSVKTNIGHAEAAAGVVGLTKVALQLHHRTLVPSLHAEKENAKVRLDATPFFIQRRTETWKPMVVAREGQQVVLPRRAGISSFGASGSNAHLILEESPDRGFSTGEPGSLADSPLVVPLSARSQDQLRAMAQRLLTYLDQAGEAIRLLDLAFTLQTGRRAFEERAAFVVGSTTELVLELRGFLNGTAGARMFRGTVGTGRNGNGNGNGNGVSPSSSTDSRTSAEAKAREWVHGHQVQWDLIPGEAVLGVDSPRRLHLPTYPFERSRHWIPRLTSPVKTPSPSGETIHFSPRWRECELDSPRRQVTPATGPVHLFAAMDFSGAPWRALTAAALADTVISLPPAGDAATWVEQAVLVLFRHCQALVREKTAVIKRVVVCVPYNGSEYPYRSLMGLLRSLSLESHFLQTKLIFHAGFDALPSAKVIDQIDGEVRYWDGHGEILYTGDGARYVLSQQIVQLPPPSSGSLRQGGVYWITGGLGGLGRLFARQLGRVAKARLILSGRSPLSESTQSRLAELRNEGLDVTYLPCDFGIRPAVAAAVDRILGEFGALHGVIHSAGLILDNYLANKSEVEVQQVLLAKVRGTQWLDEFTQSVPLDFFAVFSSIAALGGVGQLDYAAGNAFLDAFAHERNRQAVNGGRSGRTISFNWPLWKDGGMSPGKYYEDHIQSRLGMAPLESSVGFDTFLSALASNEDQVGVAVGDSKKIFSFLKISEAVGEDEKITSPPADDLLVLSAVAPTKVDEMVCEALASVFGVAKGSILRDRELTDYGADSVMLTELANHLNSAFGVDLQGSAFFELSSPQRIMDHLRSVAPVSAQVVVDVSRSHRDEPRQMMPGLTVSEAQPRVDLTGLAESSDAGTVAEVRSEISPPAKVPVGAVAIVGYDCHFPDATDPEQFWSNVIHKVVSTREITHREWHERGVHLDGEEDYGSMRWAALMSGVARFDAKFWGVDETEAAVMDPQLRLLLRCIWRCVEHSGQAWKVFTQQRVGLFVASDSVDYRAVLKRGNRQAGLNSGLSSGMLANRASYLCDFRGPSESVDTACSSVYVALNRAIQAIACGQCEAAIVGGVKVLLDPAEFAIRDRGQLLSHSGSLRSFDAQADGYVRGEGVGCVLVKSLEAARKDGDVIHAIVSGMGISHNGRGSLSPLAPDVEAQCQAMREAYKMAGVGPETIGYIEANGASTTFSDAAEMAAYRKFFKNELGPDAYRQHRLAVSAVKPNLGHLEAASGMASLLRAILALGRKQIPPTAHFEKAHSSLFLGHSPFQIPTEPLDWPTPARKDGLPPQPRRVALHSIGIGGVNAHVVLEEAFSLQSRGPASDQRAEKGSALFVLSAKSASALAVSCDHWRQYLEQNHNVTGDEAISLPALADYSRLCRESMPYRLALVVPDISALVAQLRLGIAASTESVDTLGYRAINLQRSAPRKVGQAYDLSGIRTDNELRDVANKWVNGEITSWEPLSPKTLRQPGLPFYPFEDRDFWCAEPIVAAVRPPEQPVQL